MRLSGIRITSIMVTFRWYSKAAMAAVLAVLTGVSGLAFISASVAIAAAGTCKPVWFIGARGSGEPATQGAGMGKEIYYMASVVSSAFANEGVGMVSMPVTYPADSVNDLKPNSTVVALLERGQFAAALVEYKLTSVDKYDASMTQGIKQAEADVAAVVSSCPDAEIVMGGYSQGAVVVHDAENWLVNNNPAAFKHIVGTLLLGDPDRVSHTNAKPFGDSPAGGEGLRVYLHLVKAHDVPAPATTANIVNAGDMVGDFRGIPSLENAKADTTVHSSYETTVSGRKLLASAANWVVRQVRPVITTTKLPSATVGKSYTTQLTTADHRAGTWKITAGTLPAGLTLAGYTISGTPTAPGIATFTLSFTDTYAQTATAAATLTVSGSGPVAQYAGHIVQWNGDTKAQKTAWYVTADLKRLWIPDTTTYNCLKSRGAPGPVPLSAANLDALPDQNGHWAPCGNQMWTSRELRRGMSLTSSDGRFTLVLQASDGNFVLYGPGGRALWASGRAADFVVMQGDGNLVGYTNAGVAAWATTTAGSGATHLVVQSDGNLVLYAGSRAVWATGTNWAGEVGHIVQWNGDTKAQKTAWYVTPDYKREWIPDIATYNCLKSHGAPGPDVLPAATLNRLPDQNGQWVPCGDTMATSRVLRRGMSLHSADGRYTLVLQASDGNFVLYGPGGALWASGRAADFVVMQGDGNLVGYTNAGVPTWATNTAGSGGNRLVVQDDGNVVIYSPSRAVWATNT